MIWRQCRVRRAARQGDGFSALVDDEIGLGIALENTAHIADIVQQAGHDEVIVVDRFNTFTQRPSSENVTVDQGHKHRVLEIMIERIGSAEAFHGAPGERTQSLGAVILRRAEYLPKIFGEKLAEPFGRNGRNCPHLIGLIIDHWDCRVQRHIAGCAFRAGEYLE